jgi:tetratricopeptide (TPR) repeat protein
MTRLIVTITAAAAMLLLLARDAHADAQAIARAHSLKGGAHHRAGRYDEALAEYQAAYEAAPDPGFLFMIGQAYRMKGDKPRALATYQKYLAAQPASGPIGEAQHHVSELAAKIELEQALEEERRRTEAERARADAERKRADEAVRKGPQPPFVPGKPVRDDAERASGAGQGLRVAGLVTGGVGLVALGGAVYFGLRVMAISAELSQPQPVWDERLDRLAREEGPEAERNLIIFSVVGGAAVIGGVVLYGLGVMARDRALAVVPVVGPQQAGIAVVGRF